MASNINYGSISSNKLARMLEVGRQLNSATDMNSLLHQIIHEAADLLEAEGISLLLYDPKIGALRFTAAVGGTSATLINKIVPLENSIAGKIFTSNAPMLIDDAQSATNWNNKFDKATDFKTETIIGVPLHDGPGIVVGVLEAINKKEGTFGEQDLDLLATFADMAGVAISKAQLFEELQDAYDQLNELDALKSNFIAVASHELRTPLSVIMGYVSFLRESAVDDQLEQLDLTMNAAMQLRKLIQDMVNLQYVDSGQSVLNYAEFDIADLVREVLRERDQLVLSKNLGIKVHLPKTSLQITADREMIKLVIDNLVSNAIKFTPDGGRVDVGAAKRRDEIWFYIRDSGIGIPQDQLKRIFDRFYQVEHHLRRHHEGLGLGLSIVKELVNRHDGRVWAESKNEKGSEFFVALTGRAEERGGRIKARRHHVKTRPLYERSFL